MCFSASASFGASVILAGVGVVTLKKAKKPPQRLFVLIPFVFAMQQFIEGFLWLSFTNDAYASWKVPCTYGFLFFAEIVWPVWVPLSILFLEKNVLKKKILKALLGIGILLSSELAFFILNYRVVAELTGYHILYKIYSPEFLELQSIIFYGLATVLPPFLSSIKKVRWLGVALIVSYIISRVYFADYVTSVWCYFAAIISGMILLVVWESKRPMAAA